MAASATDRHSKENTTLTIKESAAECAAGTDEGLGANRAGGRLVAQEKCVAETYL